MTQHFYEPRTGHGLAHDPLNSIVAPRPIGWISTLGKDGVANLAPYSFFNLFNYVPPIIGFSSMGWKDSVENAEASGEFVWNLATRDLAVPMNASSATVAPGVDEFDLAGLERRRPVWLRRRGLPQVPCSSNARLRKSSGCRRGTRSSSINGWCWVRRLAFISTMH